MDVQSRARRVERSRCAARARWLGVCRQDCQAGGALFRRTRVRDSGVKHDTQELYSGAVWAKCTSVRRVKLAHGLRWRRNVRARQVDRGPDRWDPTVGEIERKVRWTSGSLLRKTGQAS
jgi:hypothetical protein